MEIYVVRHGQTELNKENPLPIKDNELIVSISMVYITTTLI